MIFCILRIFFVQYENFSYDFDRQKNRCFGSFLLSFWTKSAVYANFSAILRIYFVIMPLLRDFLLSAHIFAFATSRLTQLRLVVSLSVSGTQIYLSNKKADGFSPWPEVRKQKRHSFSRLLCGKKSAVPADKKGSPEEYKNSKNIKNPCFTKRPPSGKKQTNTARFFFGATIFSADRTVSTRKE